MNQETYSQEVEKLLNDYKELRLAAADVLMAQNEYSDKAHGYRYGGASWADWDEEYIAKLETELFTLINKDLTKQS